MNIKIKKERYTKEDLLELAKKYNSENLTFNGEIKLEEAIGNNLKEVSLNSLDEFMEYIFDDFEEDFSIGVVENILYRYFEDSMLLTYIELSFNNYCKESKVISFEVSFNINLLVIPEDKMVEYKADEKVFISGAYVQSYCLKDIEYVYDGEVEIFEDSAKDDAYVFVHADLNSASSIGVNVSKKFVSKL